ncbi:hypothetical protein Z951_23615 [Streptomyces sp. PRh5]|nr:hypothetical protein Z951_23615 [Streptomyces sp. PRh5]
MGTHGFQVLAVVAARSGPSRCVEGGQAQQSPPGRHPQMSVVCSVLRCVVLMFMTYLQLRPERSHLRTSTPP